MRVGNSDSNSIAFIILAGQHRNQVEESLWLVALTALSIKRSYCLESRKSPIECYPEDKIAVFTSLLDCSIIRSMHYARSRLLARRRLYTRHDGVTALAHVLSAFVRCVENISSHQQGRIYLDRGYRARSGERQCRQFLTPAVVECCTRPCPNLSSTQLA